MIPFSFRIEPALYKAARAAAQKNNHSLNHEINLRLAAALGITIKFRRHYRGLQIDRIASARTGRMKCSRCEKIKPLADFRRRGKYWQSWCTQCLTDHGRERMKKFRAEAAADAR
jgi:hypothetical protein